MMNNGTQFFTCNDSVTRDSADRNIMAWDFNKAVVVSNQIYQVRLSILCILYRLIFVRALLNAVNIFVHNIPVDNWRLSSFHTCLRFLILLWHFCQLQLKLGY